MPYNFQHRAYGKMSMKKRKVSDIQSVIMTVLSLMTVITSISLGLLLYNRYEMAMHHPEINSAYEALKSAYFQFPLLHFQTKTAKAPLCHPSAA